MSSIGFGGFGGGATTTSSQAPRTPLSHGGLLGIDPDELGRLTATKLVRVYVGHDGAEFSVHPDLMFRLSAALRALINCQMQGSSEHSVTVRDVDIDVFSRFIQFIYTGAYTGFPPVDKNGPATPSEGVAESKASIEAVPNIRLKDALLYQWPANQATQERNIKGSSADASSVEYSGGDQKDGFIPYSLASFTTASTEPTGGGRFGGPRSVLCPNHRPGSPFSSKRKFDTAMCGCGPTQRRRGFISAFMEKYGGVESTSGDNWPTMWHNNPNQKTMSFEPVFVGHARVWVFADRLNISSLMDRAFSQLVRELAQWTISPSAFVPEFGGLVRYVYGYQLAEGGRLRQLVAAFGVCVVDDLSNLEGWPALLEEVPAFAADLVGQMMYRFN